MELFNIVYKAILLILLFIVLFVGGKFIYERIASSKLTSLFLIWEDILYLV